MILIIFVPENSAVEASVVILILMLLAVGKYWRKTLLQTGDWLIDLIFGA
jgi:hypothetical protein